MIKNLLFTLILFLIFNFSFAQSKTDLTKTGLKGKVSFMSCSEYSLVEKFGEIEKGSLNLKDTYKYDEKGNNIELNFYNAEGSLYSKDTYKYDEKGNNIELNFYNADGSMASKRTYKYDEKGNKIELNFYKTDGSLSSKQTYKYEFDTMGNWIKQTTIIDGKPSYLSERMIEYY